MKKNYFKIMAAAMLMGMSFGLQSCVDVGESDNPSGSTEGEVILVPLSASVSFRTLQIILSRSRSRSATKPAANS